MKQIIDILHKNGMAELIRRGISELFWTGFGPFLAFSARDRLRQSSATYMNPKDCVDFVYSFSFLGLTVKPLQVREEILGLVERESAINAKTVIEIGTCSGGTLFLFSRMAENDAHVISIDLPGGSFGGGYPLWKTPLLKGFAIREQRITLIRADSHNPRTVERVRTELRGSLVDFLFIDGDHTYEGAKTDFETYSRLVRKGGIVALHDIAPHIDSDVGVPRLWQEIKTSYSTEEIINRVDQGWGGIGIVTI